MPVPMLPPAPDLLSTTNGTPSLACMCCCRMRASRSADPPAANGTTMGTWRCRHSCAQAGAPLSAAPAMQAARMARIRNLGIKPIECRGTCAGLHRLQMGVALLVELLVGVAHGVRPAASQHDLHVDRLQA